MKETSPFVTTCNTTRRVVGCFLLNSFRSAGGTGGLGLLTATWLAEQNVLDLVLTGRTGRIPRPQDLHALAHAGCLVTLYAGDASMAETARGLAHCAGSHGATLGGVLHAAGLQVLFYFFNFFL